MPYKRPSEEQSKAKRILALLSSEEQTASVLAKISGLRLDETRRLLTSLQFRDLARATSNGLPGVTVRWTLVPQKQLRLVVAGEPTPRPLSKKAQQQIEKVRASCETFPDFEEKMGYLRPATLLDALGGGQLPPAMATWIEKEALPKALRALS